MTLNLSEVTEIKHIKDDDVVVSKCERFKYYHSTNAESVEDAALGFTDAEGNPAETLGDYLAATFHLIQQTGGTLVYGDREVRANSMDQCSGIGFTKLTVGSVVWYGDQKVQLAWILSQNDIL